jgi:hypothetical protein
MKKLSTLVDAIKAALKHSRSAERSRRSSERVKASVRGRYVCAIPGVAYAPVRCREHTVVRRRKVIDRF